MSFVRVHELSCAFCRKSQRDAKALIASHYNHIYICDECATLGPLNAAGVNPIASFLRLLYCRD
jgi:hypothetical protein